MCRLTHPMLVLLLMPLAISTARAADQSGAPPAPLPANQNARPSVAVGMAKASDFINLVNSQADESVAPPMLEAPLMAPVAPGLVAGGMPPVQAGYPYLNAPLYPCPQPNVPVQVGSTLITNQAFAPQEMLYPHDYEALYPPFYYRAKGRFVRTPFGTKTDEKWELMGTRVKVQYRSAIPIWTGFHVPHNDLFDWDHGVWANPAGTNNSSWGHRH